VEAAALRAPQVEDVVIEALSATTPTFGGTGLLCALVGEDAAALAQRWAGTSDILARALTPIVLRSFPTPAVLDTARRIGPLGTEELADRLRVVALFSGQPAPVDPAHVCLHCRACGHAWNDDALPLVRAGLVVLPRPAVTCPSCQVLGEVVAAVPPGRDVAASALYLGLDETPRARKEQVLADDEAEPVERVEFAELSGDVPLAERLLQLVPTDAWERDADRAAGLLLRLGHALEAKKVLVRALRADDDLPIPDAPEQARYRALLAEACAALGEPVPEIESRWGHEPAPQATHVPFERALRIGRNDPCPCGSGKKYKKCHGV
jgi:hypothetical protein